LPDSLDRLVLCVFHPKTVELDDGGAEQHRPGGGSDCHRLLVLHERACIRAVFGLYPAHFVEQLVSGRLGHEEVTCKVAEVEALHQTEKQVRLDAEKLKTENKQADQSEWRKFRWGIIATFVTMLIDLIVHYTKFFSKVK